MRLAITLEATGFHLFITSVTFRNNSLFLFGEDLRFAHQLRDNLFDLTSTMESIQEDLRTIRLTLPLFHLYEKSNFKRKDQIENHLQFSSGRERSSSYDTVRRIQRMLREDGFITCCERRIKTNLQRYPKRRATYNHILFKWQNL